MVCNIWSNPYNYQALYLLNSPFKSGIMRLMTTPAAITDLSALPTLSSELNELNEAQLNEFASAAEALILQVNDARTLQDLRVS